MRPDRLVLVVGTATEIGKTWVGAQTLAVLRARSVSVAARKPAQSFDPTAAEATDAEVLATATGESAADVCPLHRWYEVPMAPPMAADALGRTPIHMDDLIAEMTWPDPPCDLGWVETVGGPRSPLADDGDALTLTERLDPDVVVLVADAGLGTINAVRLAAAPFDPRWPLVTFLNRYHDSDDLHRRNRRWLSEGGLTLVTSPEELASHVCRS